MLWSGILFIWELVGIDLEKAKEAGGNAGAIITAIRSPHAVPWVLLVVIVYFLFKLWVEWNQCGIRRRTMLHARIDYGSAWLVAFLACSLYAYQALSQIQLADLLERSSKARSVILGALFAIVFGITVYGEIESYRLGKRLPTWGKAYKIIMAFAEFGFFLLLAVQALRRGWVSLKPSLVGFSIGLVLLLLVGRTLKSLLERWSDNQPSELLNEESRNS